MKLLLAVTLMISFILSCQSTQQNNSYGEAYNAGRMLPSQKHYLQAYLSYAVDAEIDNIGPFSNPSEAIRFFNVQAYGKIHGAVHSSSVTPYFGTYQLAWFPSVAVDYIGRHNVVEKAYVVKNLIYCLKAVGPNNTAQYLVGIAGTDELSPDDWMNEDFTVQPLQDWLNGKGKVSKGSKEGFDIINSLTSQTMTGETNISLVDYIAKDSRKHNSSIVSVAGHSLGGALTQVYASNLKNVLPKLTVEAWVYAGPSAGDEKFASQLTSDIGANNYHAFNNKFDMIPHAWEIPALEELCTLYDPFTVCGLPLANNVYFKTIVSYLIDQSTGAYMKSPGTPIIFNKEGKNLDSGDWDCAKLDAAIVLLLSTSPDIDADLIEVYNHCNYNTQSSVKSLMVILTEMAYQHTSLYFEQFIQNPYAHNAGFLGAINTAVPSANSGLEFVLQASDVLSDFLGRIADDKDFPCHCN